MLHLEGLGVRSLAMWLSGLHWWDPWCKLQYLCLVAATSISPLDQFHGELGQGSGQLLSSTGDRGLLKIL